MIEMVSAKAVSENELHLAYRVGPKGREVLITLLFQPNTQQLAAARIDGLGTDEYEDIDLEEVVDAHVQVNDVRGLVAAVLARARAGI